ncbi:MAG: FAD-dependent oxidoreductase, partial [Sphingobium sp.]
MARVVVIGAGAMGLAAAYHAANAGHVVEVLEAGAEPGGMAAHFDFDGLSIERFYHFVCKTDVIFVRARGWKIRRCDARFDLLGRKWPYVALFWIVISGVGSFVRDTDRSAWRLAYHLAYRAVDDWFGRRLFFLGSKPNQHIDF